MSGVNWKTKVFRTTWNMWGGNPGEGIPYCTVALNHTLSEFYNATPGSWSTRGDAGLDRKSARMQRDYEAAAMMTAALRSSATFLQKSGILKTDSFFESVDINLLGNRVKIRAV